MTMEKTSKKITFQGAGEHDVSEVIMISGEHDVERGDLNARISYTFSYNDTPANFVPVPEPDSQMAEALAETMRNKLSELRGS